MKPRGLDVLIPPAPGDVVIHTAPPASVTPELLWVETVINEQLLSITGTASQHSQDIGPAFEAITAAVNAVATLRYSIEADALAEKVSS